MEEQAGGATHCYRKTYSAIAPLPWKITGLSLSTGVLPRSVPQDFLNVAGAKPVLLRSWVPEVVVDVQFLQQPGNSDRAGFLEEVEGNVPHVNILPHGRLREIRIYTYLAFRYPGMALLVG